MRSSRLDRRVRKEAQLLAREAHAALNLKRKLRGRAGDLASAVRDIDQALAARDYHEVRRGLPVLDALVDELVRRPEASTTRDYVESIGAAILIALALRAVVIEAFKIPSSSMYPTLEINDHIFVNKFIYGLRIPFTTTKLLAWGKPRRGDVIVFIYPCDPDKDYIKRVVATEGQTVEVRCNVVHVDGVPVENELVQGDTCAYDDYVENAGWQRHACSKYTERVDGHAYHTYHDGSRPRLDDEFARLGRRLRGDGRDFPAVAQPHDAPSCDSQIEDPAVDRPDQTLGEIVVTKPTAGVCELQVHYVVPAGHVFVMGDNRANSNDSRAWGSVPIANIKGKALFTWLSYRDWSPLDWGGVRWDRIGNFVE